MKIAASVKSLMEIKNVDESMAKEVRKIWKEYTREFLMDYFTSVNDIVSKCHNPPSTLYLRRIAINQVIETYGIEYLGTLKTSNDDVYYCNTGDTYATTILFIGNRLVVGCWGDYVERNLIKERS